MSNVKLDSGTGIADRIRVFLRGFIAAKEIDDDTDIFTSGYVNSMFVMQLVLFVEQEFSITVEDADLDINNFRTVRAIAGFVSAKCAA